MSSRSDRERGWRALPISTMEGLLELAGRPSILYSGESYLRPMV